MSSPTDHDPTAHLPPPLEAVQVVGDYRLLRKLGEGGMGEVWEADQVAPVRRRVAFKVIKPGMDTREVIARFEAERQALALMDHPAIAKVFDAGETPLGRPYFVLELVHGVPVTEHCDTHRLDLKQRIELFREVCSGVQHAHQKGVIHRDLKPSNILVTVVGGRAQPKIIDFGVAKATAQRLTERTMVTQLGMIMGTPEYMSPEQAEMTGQDVDTRTDVYSLGVVLYELVTGVLPFDGAELRRAGPEGIREILREREPQRPSTRASTLGDRMSAAAARRRCELPALVRHLRGDLDWIVLKALDKDRSRRYGSPQEMAADLERHLLEQPVEARPPTTAYRVGKFVRRHRAGVAVATLLVLLLIGFAAAMTVQAGRIARERDRANLEAASAQQVTDFLVGLFEVSAPSEARGNAITARQILDQGARRLETELGDQPELQARLIATIGQVYLQLGLYREAEPRLTRALALERERLGVDDPETLRTAALLASTLSQQRRDEEAERLYDDILERRRRVLGEEDPETLSAMTALATVYKGQRRYAEAERLQLVAYETARRVHGPEHSSTLSAMLGLSQIYDRLERYDESEPLLVELVATRRRLNGRDHPKTAVAVNSLGNHYSNRGRRGEAAALFEENLARQRRVLGDRHLHTLNSMNNVAFVYSQLGRFEEARALLEEAVAVAAEVLGADHPSAAGFVHTLGEHHLETGNLDEAQRRLGQALAIYERLGGHQYHALLLSQLAGLSARLGQPRAALDYAREAVERGWSADRLAADPDLESLRDEPDFLALLDSGLAGDGAP